MHSFCHQPLSVSFQTSDPSLGVLQNEFSALISLLQGYQTGGGEETCWFLGCCIHGVLRQGEWGNDNSLNRRTLVQPTYLKFFFFFYLHSYSDDDASALQTAVEVFKRIILEMEKADGNAPPEEKKCAVM